ncbi:MFS-type transporter SLC18B1 isoform X2 [Sinocyclocheilus anshuiensis]|uniref:Tubby-related protein 4-like n=1 Tax=Sinocyclocheilus anshuiensis TaxID=1608454 RepID=A0A671NEZ6_9TELE|nr:PREDICTED: MFS-type transporter SLC18B1-like isoform X2 [Sinocyclocheilus anshuiensis]
MAIDEDIGDSSPAETPATKMSRQQILTLTAMASINFSSMICYSILGPFFPNEIVQIGAKFMIVAGLFVSSGCTVLFGFLDQVSDGTVFVVLCFITRCINAIGFSAAVTSSFAVSAKVFPESIATVLGFMEIFTGLGLILGPPLGGWLYQSFGYEIPFVFTGCLLFATVPLNLWILPSFDAVPSSQNSFLRLCTRMKILLICFVVFSLSSGLGFLDATLSIFAIEKLNLSAGSVGLLMIGLSLPYGAASPVFGVISDKYPSIRKWMMVIGGMATAVSFCFLGPLPIFHIRSQLWLTVLMLIVVGFSLCMTCIPTFAEMIACAHENGFEEDLSTLGLVSGLFSAVWSAGMFFGPTIGGYITQALNFEWSAGVQGALAFLAALLQVIYFTLEDIQRKSQKANRTDTSLSQGEKSPLLPKTDHLRVDVS